MRVRRPRSTRRGLSGSAIAVDLALAGVSVYVAVTLTAEVLATSSAPPSGPWAHLVAVLHGGSVAVRRLAPYVAVAGLLLTAALFDVALALPVFMLGPAVLFVAYAVGARLDRRRAVLLLGATEAAMALLLVVGPGFPGWDSALLYGALVAGAWVLGALARGWQTMAAESAQRAAELEAARTELARHAVVAERVRIARELHDVIAHSMSVIAMHAGAARLAVATDPQAERSTLEIIERTSRDALAEMRRLVTVLREEDAPGAATRQPAPSVTEVHRLVAGVAAAGVTVDVRTEGDLDAIPAGVSLAAYRVVQEALTNVLRHAGPTHARLQVRAQRSQVVIRVEDDGRAGPRVAVPAAGGGHGADGMRERVELYGGSLDAGSGPDGGWTVEARLPYRAVDR